ncbi:MAG: NAD(P)-dependent oxidoreductase [Nitriliruptorales bacterium]|nr:NAD(P)-dependent oxidoreductase [Nitriliruptorales bacterium]
MNVVLTGAAGFIGRHVAATLVARGANVIGIDRRIWTPLHGERCIVDDLATPSPATLSALASTDGVIHLAGRPGVRDDGPDAARARRRDNIAAGRVVLAATPHHAPVVVASSSSVYGGAPGRPSHEDDPLAPRGSYARSKVALEGLCARRAEQGGRVSVARPFTVAGEGQRPDMAFARWIEAARRGLPLTLYGSSDTRRDITDVRDVAEGLVRMLERDVQTTINLGSGTSYRLDDLIQVVGAVLGTEVAVQPAPAHPAEVTATLADTTRCRELLDLAPSSDITSLVARQADIRDLEVVA